jgi:hypothetical protein
MVTPEVRERFQQRGKQFSCEADVLDAASPKEWVQQQHVRFQDTGERETLVKICQNRSRVCISCLTRWQTLALHSGISSAYSSSKR